MVEALEKSMFAIVDEKGFVPDEVRNAFFRKLRLKSDNRSCFECNNRNPTWISVTYGIYLCLECSGEHRRKGTHLSFVRSVELDRFKPIEMIQMAVGGNAKAWEYFKASGMGKLCETGRTVDYNSKITLRYKQMCEVAVAENCRKFEIKSKEELANMVALVALDEPAKKSADPVDEAADFSFDSPKAAPAPGSLARGASAPAATANGGYPKAAPMVAALPASTVKVIRATSDSAPSTTSIPTKPSGFVAKQKAKEIDFDFDFDDLEKEASKPAPAPAPKAAPKAIPKAGSPTNGSAKPMFASLNENQPAPTIAPAPADAKFANKKGISSDDFFQEERGETASARMEREGRYNKFSGAGAISSSSFFGDGESPDQPARSSSGNSVDWGDLAAGAKQGISKGADLLATYLNKARN
mmetsp:Transcript_164921/g.529382  ORF Transcript_164921/g.529382 Transcript_164921/m.529382 type:complete len:413 (-) Transcript_164921:146-1384(-)